jgi:hypothetical protein
MLPNCASASASAYAVVRPLMWEGGAHLFEIIQLDSMDVLCIKIL